MILTNPCLLAQIFSNFSNLKFLKIIEIIFGQNLTKPARLHLDDGKLRFSSSFALALLHQVDRGRSITTLAKCCQLLTTYPG